MLRPNVLYAGLQLEVHRGMKLRINGNRLCKLYESRIFGLFTKQCEHPKHPGLLIMCRLGRGSSRPNANTGPS